jgi:tetratricopeptide (TPR) repeat protein
MKSKKQATRRTPRAQPGPAVAEASPAPRWPYAVGIALAVAAVFEVYGPSLNGPFLFDDQYLPFGMANFPLDSLRAWMAGVRPLLMFSYWINYQLSELRTFSYHAFNVLFHAANAALLFFIVRKVLEFAQVERGRRDLLAAFASALFLLHPVNSEAVAYVASRSENFSVLFFFGAFAAFLYRRTAACSWARSAAILLLFTAAALTKEHTVVLPALLLLTDYFWNPPFSFDGIRRNWRLYAPVAAGGVLMGLFVARQLRGAESAGFGMKDLKWYEYFFTQCRALWVYIRLFLFPAGLNADYDFPISRTILDHGAIFGFIAIVLAGAAAFYFRRRYPLAAYGFFSFLILMAPTSSFVPIKDPVAERRLYLSMIGLLFIALDLLRRVNVKQAKWSAALAAVLVLAGVFTYQRNKVWSDAVLLWEDTVTKSPKKARDQFQLAQAYYERGDCGKALPHYDAAAKLDFSDDRLFIDWGLAFDCLNQPDQALVKFRQAATLKATAHAYSQIGMIFGKQGKNAEALEALATAQKLDPRFEMTYVYRGGVRLATGDAAAAIQEFRQALAINPQNQPASQGLAMAEARLRPGR